MAYEKRALTIAVSTRALFSLETENKIYEADGIEAYIKYQIDHEQEILQPGVAFNLVRKLLKLNERPELKDKQIEVLIISRSCPDISVRIFNSIEKYGLNISRAVFTGGNSTVPYIKSMGIDLYLSTNEEDVSTILKNNIAAGIIYNQGANYEVHDRVEEIKIAFDGDCVCFNSEAEDIFQEHGLKAFETHETEKKNIPLGAGPFKGLLIRLGEIQRLFDYDNCPIQIALCTARNAPCHERAVKTLRSWKLRVNQSFFLGGMSKVAVLEGFNADIFFDDQHKWVEEACKVVPACLVK